MNDKKNKVYNKDEREYITSRLMNEWYNNARER